VNHTKSRDYIYDDAVISGRQIAPRCVTGCLWFFVVFGSGCQASPDHLRDEDTGSTQTKNVVWIVADAIPVDLERRFDVVAALQSTHYGGASARSALLTGVDPGLLRPFSEPVVGVLPLLFRQAGYYTSRSGE
ncbi:uncharacterized protein METZ01_LOCUS362165, partial [marine metagenome]